LQTKASEKSFFRDDYKKEFKNKTLQKQMVFGDK